MKMVSQFGDSAGIATFCRALKENLVTFLVCVFFFTGIIEGLGTLITRKLKFIKSLLLLLVQLRNIQARPTIWTLILICYALSAE